MGGANALPPCTLTGPATMLFAARSGSYVPAAGSCTMEPPLTVTVLMRLWADCQYGTVLELTAAETPPVIQPNIRRRVVLPGPRVSCAQAPFDTRVKRSIQACRSLGIEATEDHVHDKKGSERRALGGQWRGG